MTTKTEIINKFSGTEYKLTKGQYITSNLLTLKLHNKSIQILQQKSCNQKQKEVSVRLKLVLTLKYITCNLLIKLID